MIAITGLSYAKIEDEFSVSWNETLLVKKSSRKTLAKR